MGLKLAEEGRHEEALQCIREHLRRYPKDHQALNDAGVILFCSGVNEEAIDHLEKAKACCPASEAGEILWNLCEVYLAAGYPGMAMTLFDAMERQELLNADLLNRGAQAFLQQDMYGHAIELLIRSLEMAPSQEILEPMIAVIRSRRPKVGVFAAAKNAETQRLFEFVGQRFVATLHTGAGLEEMRSLLGQCDIAFFDGCCDTLVDVSYRPAACKLIVRLSDADVYSEGLGNLCWQSIDAVVLSDNPVIRERLFERFGDLDKQVHVATAGMGVDTKRFGFAEKGRGKRIACLDVLTSRNNPMLLLQCMQKLHYIDADYRLYFAGGFADGATEDYVRYMVEAMELSNVVFFDGGVRSEAGWLRDKHYVVTAAMTADGMEGVLKGMSCGLKPVVHNFPGAGRMFDEAFVFNIAEDFCGQVLSAEYEPRRYRRIVETRYSEAVGLRGIKDVLFRLEKLVVKDDSAAEPAAVAAAEARADVVGGAGAAAAAGGFEMTPREFMPGFGAAAHEPVAMPAPTAWSARHAGAAPVQTAAQHLCDRVGSINQMSANVLRDWKAFAEQGPGGGGEMQPVEIGSSAAEAPFAEGGLKITELPTRRRSVPTPVEVKHVPFV